MEKTIQDNILAHCMELALMPALLYSYRDGGVLYWIVLILMDDYILKHQDVKGLLPLWRDARYKKDIRLLLILEGCMLAGIVIIAFKNWQVSAILLVNDLILDFIGYLDSIIQRKTNRNFKNSGLCAKIMP